MPKKQPQIKLKKVWLCLNCHSDNVYSDLNSGKYKCFDCQCDVEVISCRVPEDAKVLGFQVVNEDG